MAGTSFHTNVSLRGYHFEDFHFTGVLAAGITVADIGKAVMVDTSAANKFKLVTAGETIVGRLEVVEDRTVEGQLIGTISFKFMNTLPISGTVAVGDTVVGGDTAGHVDRLEDTGVAAPNHSINFVAEIIEAGTTDYAVVVKI